MSNTKRLSLGFTLVEVLAVVVIIIVLAMITTYTSAFVQKSSRDVSRESKTRLLAETLESYYTKNNEYPSVALISSGNAPLIKQKLNISDGDILKFPGATTESSVGSANPSSSLLTYSAGTIDASANNQCQTDVNGYCDAFQLQYKKEYDNALVTVKSRNKSYVAIGPSSVSPPTQPNVVGAQINSTTVRFTASNATCGQGTVEYKIRYGTTSTLPDWSTVAWSATTTLSINPGSNTVFYSQSLARCVSGANTSADSAPSTVHVLNFTPVNTPPGNFLASSSATGSTSGQISWSTPSGTTPITYSVSGSGSASSCTSTPCNITGLTASTSYTFVITATNAYGTSQATTTFTTSANPVVAPGSFTASSSNLQPTSATISWSTPSGTAPITYSVSGGGSGCASTSSTSCSVTGLTPNTAYTMTVTASNGSGTSTAQTSFTTPSTPGSFVLTATAVSSQNIALSWTTPSGTPTMTYSVSIASGNNNCAASATSCNNTGLNPNTQYCYTVTASNGYGTSTSNQACAKTNYPALLVSNSGSDKYGNVTLNWAYENNWTPPSGTTFTASRAAGNYADCSSVSGYTCTIARSTSCSLDVTITVQANATGGNVQGATYVPLRAKPVGPPSDPYGLNVGRQSVTWNWYGVQATPSDATGFVYKVVQYTANFSTSPGGMSAPTSESARNASVTGLNPNTNYRIWMQAVNCAGNSTDASSAIFTTNP